MKPNEKYVLAIIIFFYVSLMVFAAFADRGMKIHEIDKTRPHIDRSIEINYTILKIRMDHVDLVRRDTFLMPESVKRKIQQEIHHRRYRMLRGLDMYKRER